MEWVGTVFLGIALIVLWFFSNRFRRGSSLPPGPTPLPFIGNLIQIGLQDPVNFLALHKLSKKYGDLTSLKIGSQDYLLVSSSSTAVDLYSRADCLNRPTSGAIQDRNLKQNIGMAFSNDEGWQNIRKFTSKSLRQFGFGNRSAMAKLVKEELINLVDDLQQKIVKSKDGVLCFDQSFQTSFLNLMSSMITGKRHSYDDKELQKLQRASREWFDAPILGVLTVMAFPFTRHICPGFLGYTQQINALKDIHSYARKILDDHRQKRDFLDTPKCFTDLFLKMAEEQKENPAHIFTDDQFAVLCTDLFQGGSDTTSAWLSFAILLITCHPTVQEKIVAEISTVVGFERSPEPQDMESMPYTQAVMHEIHRFSRLVVILPPREAISDFHYKGYLIKKDTTILVNLHSCYKDDTVWLEPDSFLPERFLSTDGLRVMNAERLPITFGAGRRICFGESMAKDSGFLYFVTLLQKFSFKLPGASYPTPTLEVVPGIILSPKPFYVAVDRRRHS